MKRKRIFIGIRTAVILFVMCTHSASNVVHARPPTLTIEPRSELRFGRFAVINNGSRIIETDGTIRDQGIFSLDQANTGPARFAIVYNRGNNSKRRLDLTFHLVLSRSPRVTQDGISARLLGFRTNLPGAAQVRPGEIITVHIRNCRTSVCRRSFLVGGRLNVQRDYGGAKLSIPILADIELISLR